MLKLPVVVITMQMGHLQLVLMMIAVVVGAVEHFVEYYVMIVGLGLVWRQITHLMVMSLLMSCY